MLKLAVAVLAFALAGSASAEGWRSLRFDASSETAFNESVALFRDKLSPTREHAFQRALQDIWIQGTQKASAERRDYTVSDYYRQLDGMSYDELVLIPDPTGDRAKRYRDEYRDVRAAYRGAPGTPSAASLSCGTCDRYPPRGPDSQPRGGTDLNGPTPNKQ